MREVRDKIFRAIQSYEVIDDHGFSKSLPLPQVWALTDLVLAAIHTEKEMGIQGKKSNQVQLPPDFDCDT